MADASWLPDPSGAHELRYWNGTSWTEHVSDQGATGQDPVTSEYPPPAPVPPTPPPPPAPPASGYQAPAGGFEAPTPAYPPPGGGYDPAGATAAGAPPAGGKVSWKDRLKQAADQGKAALDQGTGSGPVGALA